ncbi:MAG: hypothetical protein ACI81W_003594, partial [Saprospiraceae bacterium]
MIINEIIIQSWGIRMVEFLLKLTNTCIILT